MTDLVGADVLAEWLGVHRRTVTDLAQRGIVIREKRGQYRLQESVRRYCTHMQEMAAGRGGEQGVLDLTAERARLAKEQADGQAIKNELARGTLVEADAVKREWAGVLRTLRSGMLAIPSRVRQTAAHLTATDIASIDREIRDTLKALADDQPPTE